jgi:hypothetical protein
MIAGLSFIPTPLPVSIMSPSTAICRRRRSERSRAKQASSKHSQSGVTVEDPLLYNAAPEVGAGDAQFRRRFRRVPRQIFGDGIGFLCCHGLGTTAIPGLWVNRIRSSRTRVHPRSKNWDGRKEITCPPAPLNDVGYALKGGMKADIARSRRWAKRRHSGERAYCPVGRLNAKMTGCKYEMPYQKMHLLRVSC